MVNLRLAKLLDEGRSKNRYLHTVSSNFTDYVLAYLRKNPLTIQQNNFTIKPAKFLTKEQKKALPKLRNITLFFIKEPNVKNLIKIPTAGYYSGDTEDTVGGRDYDFVRGEITFDVIIDENIESFEQLTSRYTYLSGRLSDAFRHEIQHYVDDYALEGGLDSQDKERSPYHFMDEKVKEHFNYLASPYEITAYVKQFMEKARRLRKPFLAVLFNYLETSDKFKFFNKNPKLNDYLDILKYKYLEYAYNTYNIVKQDPNARAELNRLESDVMEKGLYTPEYDDEYDNETFKEWLAESSPLSKYWKERAKKRAKRAGRHHRSKIDKVWAAEQQEKSTEIGNILKKSYESKIKETEALTKELEELLSLSQAKKQDAFLNKTTGRRKGFLKNARKHKGQGAVARGERFGPFGPSALEETNEN